MPNLPNIARTAEGRGDAAKVTLPLVLLFHLLVMHTATDHISCSEGPNLRLASDSAMHRSFPNLNLCAAAAAQTCARDGGASSGKEP